MYIWERPDWPNFRIDSGTLLPKIAEARYRQGRFSELMGSVGFDHSLESELVATVDDVLKTSAIEGESLNPANVRSSIARRLGLPEGGLMPADRKVEGVVEMILDATRNFEAPLTPDRLHGWHAALFPTGYSGIARIDIGRWRSDREGPMQVISGEGARRKVHFQAPPAGAVDGEMRVFLNWFNRESHKTDALVRAAIAHLWFVTIHPMDDGNGRMARAIADHAIAKSEKSGRRFYSLSSQIAHDRGEYYDVVERAQKGTMDATEWVEWFAGCYMRALETAEKTSRRILDKARFWQRIASNEPLNSRQHRTLQALLRDPELPVTTKVWKSLAGGSDDSAQRDIADLVRRGIFVRNAGGSKNTSYRIVLEAPDAQLEQNPRSPGMRA